MSTGATNTESGSGDSVSVSRTPSMNSENSSEERIRARQVARTDSSNSFGSNHHRRPLNRVSSTSSMESNSLGRRRRESDHFEETQYTMRRSSRSESNLVAPGGTARDPDEPSDTESLDGRRVRTKYANATGAHRTTSLGTALSDQNSFEDPAWSSNTAGTQDSSVNTGISSSSGDRSSGNTQLTQGLPHAVANTGRSPNAGDFPRKPSNGEGSSETSGSTSRPVPPRKNSDWEPARNRGSNSSSNRAPAPTASNPNQDILVQSHNRISTPRVVFRETDSLSPSPGRIRAQSRSSGSYEELPLSAQDSSHISPRAQRQTRQSLPEVVLPRWQPDAEVTFCPICRTQFSFFVRKHHCRKCGRVVCNSCSPHRITIPYQFIVQPPTDTTTSLAAASLARPVLDPARAGSSTNFTSLGGGERVRLCNPCVPDPNTAPPQTSSAELQHRTPQGHSRSTSLATPYHSNLYSSQYSQDPERLAAALRNYPRRTREPSNIGGASVSSSSSYTQPSTSFGHSLTNTAPGPSGNRSRSSTSTSHFNGPQRYPRPPGSREASNPQANYRSLLPREELLHERPLPRTPQIAEEDECPVCHRELPPSGRPDSEALREAHINRCIESAFGGPAASPAPSSTSTSNIVRETSRASSSFAIPVANTPEARTAAREQAHAAVVLGHTQSPAPIRRTGVFPYKASEKDCVDDAECTICLEEFEVGEEMGRLECFCRFHLRCIRQWFELHHGQCPVHQHDGGY